MTLQKVNEIMKTIAEYTRMAEEAQKVADENKELLKAYMTESELTELVGDEHKATYKEVVSNRFDSKAFKAAGHEDLYKEFTKSNTSMRFTFA